MAAPDITIDCDACTLQHTDACDDCMVTFLLDREPEDAVVIERLGQAYEAKGAQRAAADEYRRGVGLMDAAGDGQFCDCCRARLVKAIRRLDPDHPAPPLGRDP